MILDWLNGLAQSGRLADIAMAVLVAEMAVALVLYRTADQRRTILFNTVSGLALMAALRSALTGAPVIWIAMFLSAGFFAHMAELAFRHRAFRRTASPAD